MGAVFVISLPNSSTMALLIVLSPTSNEIFSTPSLWEILARAPLIDLVGIMSANSSGSRPASRLNFR